MHWDRKSSRDPDLLADTLRLKVVRFYRDWIADCPDELMTIVVQRRAPDSPSCPAEMVGKHVIAVTTCYTGPMDEGARALRPLKSFGKPLLGLCGPKPYLVHQSMFDAGFPHGWRYCVRSCNVAQLNDDVIDIVAEHGRRVVSPITSVGLWQMGGAVAQDRGERNRLQRTQRRFVSHQRQQRDGGRLRRRTRLGACVLVGAIALSHQHVRELLDGRRRGAHPSGVRGGEVQPAQDAQAHL